MVREETVQMSVQELRRVHVIRQAMDKAVRQREASEMLGITTRQVRRLIQRVQAEGDAGLVHRGRGKPSNRRHSPAGTARVLRLYATHYRDFGPTLAAEKLVERHGITLSAETLRQWLRACGIAHFTRRKRPHRAWRVRKAHVGALLQLDGSHHDWFEGRGPRCALMAYIDDASGRVFARFYEYEGTIPALDSFERYVRRYGVPYSVYTDNHTTYRARGEPTVAQQLVDAKPQSQFERALAELGVTVIHAHSPQATGRVERLFKTLQDRLVKDLRLASIVTIEAANQFMETWLPHYNRRFAVQPARAADLHRPSPTARELDRMLCLKTTRGVRRDWTVTHHGQLFQIETPIHTHAVLVEDRLDGTMRITHRGQPLRYHAIIARPVRGITPTPPAAPRRPVKPKPTHPWHRRILPDHQTTAATPMT